MIRNSPPCPILAADVAGYSRLMGADEEGTLERLKALRRDLLDPKIAEHHGRIVKTTGDGMLVEFPSVVDAVPIHDSSARFSTDSLAEGDGFEPSVPRRRDNAFSRISGRFGRASRRGPWRPNGMI
jgi:class 3 adenylate cyclase